MLFVTADQLRGLIPITEAIAAMRDAFIQVVQGNVDHPPWIALKDGSAHARMARGDPSSSTVVKLASVRSSRNVPVALVAASWGEHKAAGVRYERATAAEAARELSKIGMIAANETTLTPRRGKIQLVVFNDTGYEIQINLRLVSQGLTPPCAVGRSPRARRR